MVKNNSQGNLLHSADPDFHGGTGRKRANYQMIGGSLQQAD